MSRYTTIRNRVFLCVSLVLVACGQNRGIGTPAPDANLPAGDHEVELRLDGRDRSYRVHIPSMGQRDNLPVVLAFHGGTGNPGQFQESAGIDAIADREGFIAVYPAGTGIGDALLTWNAGPNCCGRAMNLDVDDVGFTRALVDDLANRASIDRSRVYATGHSNGAGMVYRLAAEAPDLVRAIVPVAGASMGIPLDGAPPIPLLHIHSMDDPRALYEGGLGPAYPGTDQRVEHRSVEGDLAIWRRINGCMGEPATREVRSEAGGGQSAGLLAWECENAPVQHWQLRGSGHSWPGAEALVAERIVGPPSTLISAAEEMWRFFSSLD